MQYGSVGFALRKPFAPQVGILHHGALQRIRQSQRNRARCNAFVEQAGFATKAPADTKRTDGRSSVLAVLAHLFSFSGGSPAARRALRITPSSQYSSSSTLPSLSFPGHWRMIGPSSRFVLSSTKPGGGAGGASGRVVGLWNGFAGGNPVSSFACWLSDFCFCRLSSFMGTPVALPSTNAHWPSSVMPTTRCGSEN